MGYSSRTSFVLVSVDLFLTLYPQAHRRHGVTLSTPPKDDMFSMFVKTDGNDPNPSMAAGGLQQPIPSTSMPGIMPGMMNPYGFVTPMPYVLPPPPHSSPYYPQTPSTHYYARRDPRDYDTPPRRRKDDFLSSDPPDEEIIYPGITDFLKVLHEKHPQRGLSQYFDEFEAKDFYNIDEISAVSSEMLIGTTFGFSAGNAQFFLDAVQKEIKKINRAGKDSSRGRRR